MKFFKFLLTFSIFSTAIVGDYVVFKSKYSNNQLFRALTDSLVHASIGLLSSVLFFSHLNISIHTSALSVLFCTLLSSLIDIDHAIMAKSLYLKDMTNLKRRGFLHCTTLWLLLTAFLLALSYYYKKTNIYLLTFMIIIAYTSHHIRDANRRGLWLFPFGHTKPLRKPIYVSLLCVLPHLYGILYNTFSTTFKRLNTIQYEMVV